MKTGASISDIVGVRPVRILGPNDNTRRADGKVGCDCTVRCGDDPWLRDGKSYPCKMLQDEWDAETARKAAMAARMTMATLAPHLALITQPEVGQKIRELCNAAEYGWRTGFDPSK